MKKKIALGTLALLTLVSLTGCIGDGDVVNKNTNGGAFTEFQYKKSDGKLMDCLRYDRGITCDWQGAK